MITPTAGPPSKHQLALMIWIAVFPTLAVLNLTIGDWLVTLTPVIGPSCWPPSPCRSSSTASCPSFTRFESAS